MTGSRRGGWGFWAALAALSLTLKVMAPAGFMMAPGAGRLPLVICTAHGPVSLTGSNDHAPKRAPPSSDKPCVFCGHGVASISNEQPPLATAFLAQVPTPVARQTDLTPGRGLAAPPPPSQAPPVLL